MMVLSIKSEPVVTCWLLRARLTCAQCYEHAWLKQDTNTMKTTKLSKERMKKYILRRKWQVTNIKHDSAEQG